MAKDKDKRKKDRRASVPATPILTAEPVTEPLEPPLLPAGAAPRRLLSRLGGARLCYGKPVRGGELTVVPVARVRVAGGFGDREEGTGGGGYVDADPVGYIEVGPDGARFCAIPDPDRALRVARSLALTAAGALGAAAALRSLTR